LAVKANNTYNNVMIYASWVNFAILDFFVQLATIKCSLEVALTTLEIFSYDSEL